MRGEGAFWQQSVEMMEGWIHFAVRAREREASVQDDFARTSCLTSCLQTKVTLWVAFGLTVPWGRRLNADQGDNTVSSSACPMCVYKCAHVDACTWEYVRMRVLPFLLDAYSPSSESIRWDQYLWLLGLSPATYIPDRASTPATAFCLYILQVLPSF